METYPYEDRVILDPLSDGVSEVELVEFGGSPLSVVNAARVSHAKRSDWATTLHEDGAESHHLSHRDQKLTRYLLEHEHGSPFESSYWEVRVKMPIFVFRHLVRHRHLSPNEASGRYIELDEQFYIPTEWRVQSKKNHQASFVDDDKPAEWHREQTALLQEAYQSAYSVYKKLLQNGVAREMARFVLPLGLYTEVILRGNLRSLMHLMHLRDTADTQYETQQVARAIYKSVYPVFRETLDIWEDVREGKEEAQRLRELLKDESHASMTLAEVREYLSKVQ